MSEGDRDTQTPSDAAAASNETDIDSLLAELAAAQPPAEHQAVDAVETAAQAVSDIDALLSRATFDDAETGTGVEDSGPSDPTHESTYESPSGSEAQFAHGMLPHAVAMDLPELQRAMSDAHASSIDLLRDVELDVKIELGRSRMLVEDVLKLGEGSVVELDKLAGDPVDVFVNERLVARGEVLVLNDTFCVRVNEIVSNRGDA
jgi:flagellar motor switch protein FliN/FliY